MFYNYIWTNKLNRKKYTGITINPKRRFISEKSEAFNIKSKSKNYDLPFYRAIRKNADNDPNKAYDNWNIEIVAEWDTREEAEEYEIWLIYHFMLNVRRFGNEWGYNLTDGGDKAPSQKGKPKSEEHKRKISESNKGKHDHKGEKNPFYGKTKEAWNKGIPQTDVVKGKLSLSRLANAELYERDPNTGRYIKTNKDKPI